MDWKIGLDKYLTTPPDDDTDTYREIEQDPDMSDSDMMEVIKEYLTTGWRLSEYKWDNGVKIWVFEF